MKMIMSTASTDALRHGKRSYKEIKIDIYRSSDVHTTTSMNCKNQDGSLSERKRNDGSLNGRKRLAQVDAAKNIVRGRKVLMLGHLM